MLGCRLTFASALMHKSTKPDKKFSLQEEKGRESYRGTSPREELQECSFATPSLEYFIAEWFPRKVTLTVVPEGQH